MLSRTAAPVPAYKAASRQTWIDALVAVFAVLHDIQWRAPWDTPTENVCKAV